MREMKDSGVEWIGEIPENWEIKPLKNLFSFGKGLPITKADLIDSGVPTISYGQIHAKYNKGVHVIDSLFRFVNESYLITNFDSIVTPKSFVFADTSEDLEGCGNYVFNDSSDRFFAGYHTIIMTPYNNENNYKYFAYLFLTDVWRFQLRIKVSAVKVYSIPQKILKQTSVTIPSFHEQEQIVSYLDTKCAEIDSIAEDIQKEIETLQEYRKSVITEAVTKGLDPNVEIKDSGVEWIGMIPKHWNVSPFTKYLESIIDYRGKTPEKVDEGTLLVTAKNIKNGAIDYEISREYVKTEEYEEIMHRGKLKIGDMLFTTEAPLGEVANVDRTDFALAQRVIKFRGKKDLVDNYFMKYWFMSYSFQENLKTFATGSTALGIKASKLSKLRLMLPPLREQNEIVVYLDTKCAEIDSIISDKQRQLDTLAEYRKSLIYEYVTGKKEVV